jgi:hypothetical protein
MEHNRDDNDDSCAGEGSATANDIGDGGDTNDDVFCLLRSLF